VSPYTNLTREHEGRLLPWTTGTGRACSEAAGPMLAEDTVIANKDVVEVVSLVISKPGMVHTQGTPVMSPKVGEDIHGVQERGYSCVMLGIHCLRLTPCLPFVGDFCAEAS